jgi:hypothetical protein
MKGLKGLYAVIAVTIVFTIGLTMSGFQYSPAMLTIDTLYNIDTVARVSTAKDSTRTKIDDSSKALAIRKYTGQGWILVSHRRVGGDSAQFQVTIGEKSRTTGAFSNKYTFTRSTAATINSSKFQKQQVDFSALKDTIKAYFNVSGEKGTDAERPGYAVTVLVMGFKKNN